MVTSLGAASLALLALAAVCTPSALAVKGSDYLVAAWAALHRLVSFEPAAILRSADSGKPANPCSFIAATILP